MLCACFVVVQYTRPLHVYICRTRSVESKPLAKLLQHALPLKHANKRKQKPETDEDWGQGRLISTHLCPPHRSAMSCQRVMVPSRHGRPGPSSSAGHGCRHQAGRPRLITHPGETRCGYKSTCPYFWPVHPSGPTTTHSQRPKATAAK